MHTLLPKVSASSEIKGIEIGNPSRRMPGWQGDRNIMHILIDGRIIRSSTGTFVERLLRHLQDIDGDNRYTVLIERRDDDYWSPTRSNFTKFLVDIPQHSMAEQTRLRQVIRSIAPDVVHFCMPQQPLLLRGPAIVTMFQDLTILRMRNPHRGVVASLAKRASGWLAFAIAARQSTLIATPSACTRDDLIATLHAPADRIQVVHYAADHRPDALESCPLPFGEYLLYVGRHPAYKNLKRLADAHQMLARRRPDLGLVFVGGIDADAEETRRHCNERGYRNIHFTGFLPEAQRDWLYAHCSAYVFPSFAEGFGLPGLEAMACGAPVVSSDATCLPEILGDAAVYFDPRDTTAMAGAIERVLDDPMLRQTLIAAGREQLARYSWRRTAEEMLLLYRAAALARKRSA